MKEGGGDAPPAAAARGKPPSPQKKSSLPLPRMSSKVQSHQIVINPNTPLNERPVAALTAAILTNTIIDYEIVSDHLSRHTCLGVEGSVVMGDFAMARYIVRNAQQSDLLGGSSPPQQAVLDAWVDYAQSLSQLPEYQRISGIGMTLEHALQNRTHLVGTKMSMADICLFAALGFPSQVADKAVVSAKFSEYVTAKRSLTIS